MNRYIIHIILFVLLSFGISDTSQASTIKDNYYENSFEKRSFDDKAWKEAVGDIDYTPEAIKKKKEKENNNTATNSGGGSGGNTGRDFSAWDWNVGTSTLSGFFKLLLIILAVLLLGIIIYRLSGGGLLENPTKDGSKGKVSDRVDIEKVEQNLHKSDMEILIDQSLKDGNYMLAVRLYYLWAIKELSNKHFIKWKRDKTNRDYARELRKTDLHPSFRKVTRIFERVWYGNQKELDQKSFGSIEAQFKSFVESIKRK